MFAKSFLKSKSNAAQGAQVQKIESLEKRIESIIFVVLGALVLAFWFGQMNNSSKNVSQPLTTQYTLESIIDGVVGFQQNATEEEPHPEIGN